MSAQVAALKTTVAYTIKIDGVTQVSLNVAIDLRSMEARGTYSTAPSQGS